MIWIILLVALFLRLVNLNQSLWLDEATQAILSQKSLYSIWFERAGDFHPPLSYLLYHFWMFLGTSEIWLRFLSVLFGVATIFIIYKISKKLFNQQVAIFAALFMATAPFHIYYSQEIRMYAIATFFALLSMYYFVRDKRIGYVLSTTALIYTHYMGGFLILAQMVYLFFHKKGEILNYLKYLGFIFLLYIPWAPRLLNQLENGFSANQYLPGWANFLSLDPSLAIPLTFLKFSIGRINFDNLSLYSFFAAVVLAFFGYLTTLGLLKNKTKEVKLLLFWLLIPIFLAWLISFLIPINQPFRLLFCLPAFYILLAIGIETLSSRIRPWRLAVAGVLLVNFLSAGIYFTNPKFQREDWRGAVSFINKSLNENSKVIFAWSEPFPPYYWYQGKDGIGVVKKFPATENGVSKNMEALNSKKEIYFFEYLQALSDPNRYTSSWLTENGYSLKQTLNFNGVGLVYHYSSK